MLIKSEEKLSWHIHSKNENLKKNLTLLLKNHCTLVQDFSEAHIIIVTDSPETEIPKENKILVYVFENEAPSNRTKDMNWVISLEEMTRNPQLFARQIETLYTLTQTSGLAREWRDTVIQKLQSKSELLERMNERLQRLSITDDLTGLYNYRFFRQILSDELERAERYNFPLSLLMVDIDHFKKVNDDHGHLVGDQVLQIVSRELKACCRRVDSVCRYGGEEFSIVLPMTGLMPARDLAERIRRQMTRAFPNAQTPLPSLSVSIGIATFPEHGKTAESLLAAADKALYAAKKAGRNRVMLPETTGAP